MDRTAILTVGYVSLDSVPDGLPAGFELVGMPYDIELVPELPDGPLFTLGKSVTIAFDFDEDTSNRMSYGTDSLVVYHHKGDYSGWEPLVTDVELKGRTASAKTRGFSVFALLVGDSISLNSDGSNLKTTGSVVEGSSAISTPTITTLGNIRTVSYTHLTLPTILLV